MSLDGRTATPPGDSPLDLRRAEPRAGPRLARRIRRDRGRDRHRPRRRSAAHRPQRRRSAPPAVSRRLRPPRPPAARLAAAAHPRRRPRCSSSPPRGRPARVERPARRGRGDPSSCDGRRRRALAELGRRGITSLLLEGGPTLAAAFAAAEQIDEARIFIAPLLLPPPPRAGPWRGREGWGAGRGGGGRCLRFASAADPRSGRAPPSGWRRSARTS